jgi:sugar lactone lactonase YvrE
MLTAGLALMALPGTSTSGQTMMTPTNDLPNPYQATEGWAKLHGGRAWGSTTGVDVDKDGTSIWVVERCGENSCVNHPDVDTVLKFDSTGTLVKSFGAGLLMVPHGIFVDRDGNIWVTDGLDNAPRPQSGGRLGPGDAAPAAPAPVRPAGPPAAATKGNQVIKFSPDGKVLLTLGKPGGAAAPAFFYQPNDVLTAPNGDIFVSEGHGAGNDRILKFDRNGAFIKEWGRKGTGPGEFDQPHALSMDSKGRVFVGDRANNRMQVFDQNGTYLFEWAQFGRPSGIYIDKDDTMYVADSDSVARNHDGWKRGIRIGSAKDGSLKYLIPDPAEISTGTSAAEGVAVDAGGNIYGAELNLKRLMRYVKKPQGD